MTKIIKTKRLMSIVMKHLKFANAIPLKVMVRFYMLNETLFEDGGQNNRQISSSITYMIYERGF